MAPAAAAEFSAKAAVRVAIVGCVISGNSAGAGGTGGGIFSAGTTMTITNCTLSGNSNPDSEGGGISTYTGSMTTITNSTISGNSTGYGGGGIDNYGTLAITNSTISGNSANQNGGGGIHNENVGTVYARNTIIAKNTSPVKPDFQGTLTSQGYNLIGNTSGTTITGDTTGNQLNVDPLLGPLQDNGGPTFTQALMFGSPATDKGSSGGYAVDQRGFTRPVDSPGIPNAVGGDGSDIGAFEDQNICENQIVTNNNDSGAGSLRDAIANVCTGGTITFASSVVSPINLTSDQLVIDKDLTISGPGANLLSVQRSTAGGTPTFRIFRIVKTDSDGNVVNINVTLSGLTISNGSPNGTVHVGGGINSAATLTIVGCTISGNAASTVGGGIFNNDGWTVNMANSTISLNTASGVGGGIENGGTGDGESHELHRLGQ